MNCPICGAVDKVLVTYETDVDVLVKEGKVKAVHVQVENLKPKVVECYNCLQHAFGLNHPAVKVAERSRWPEWKLGW